jgi:uncharacterized lipoprotein YbaY
MIDSRVEMVAAMIRHLIVSLVATCTLTFATMEVAFTQSATTDPPKPDPVTIKGTLTYRQRIALPPDTNVVVELRDASMPEGPVVGEHRFALNQRQVPVPFELTVDRMKLESGKPYAIRGAFFAGARAIWLSEPKTIDVSSAVIDIGALNMTQAKAQPLAPAWRCGSQRVTTSFAGDTMDLTISNVSYAMRQMIAASGARYEAIGDPQTTAWIKGDRMTLAVRGQAYPECQREKVATQKS